MSNSRLGQKAQLNNSVDFTSNQEKGKSSFGVNSAMKARTGTAAHRNFPKSIPRYGNMHAMGKQDTIDRELDRVYRTTEEIAPIGSRLLTDNERMKVLKDL